MVVVQVFSRFAENAFRNRNDLFACRFGRFFFSRLVRSYFSHIVVGRLTRAVTRLDSVSRLATYGDGIQLSKLSSCHPVPIFSPCMLEVQLFYALPVDTMRGWYSPDDENDDDDDEIDSDKS